MRNTRLIRMLSKLEKVQIRSFRDFVHSPYWNKNDKLKILCDYVTKFFPEFEAEAFNEQEAFKLIYGEETFKEQSITKLLSKLYKLFEKFILTEETDQEGVLQKLQYLNFLGRNDFMKDYNLYLAGIQKALQNDEMRDANYYYRKFLVDQELSLDFKSKMDSEAKVSDMLSAERSLDTFYLILKLNYANNLHSYQKLNPQIQFHSEFIDELENYVVQSPYFAIPTVRIWYTALQLTKSGDVKKYYGELKNLLFTNSEQLNKFDIHNISINLANHCRLAFPDKDHFYRESFELHKFLLEAVLKDDPLFFTPTKYFNLLNLAIWLEEYEWVETFLTKYKNHGVNRDDDIHHLGLAMLAFAKKDFDLVHDYLLESRLKYFYFKLYERRLWLKLYIEKKMTDQIEYQVNSLRKFLSVNRDTIANHHLDANRNFTNVVLQINKLNPLDQKSVQQLLKEIQEASASLLPEKKWLEEKVKVLLK